MVCVSSLFFLYSCYFYGIFVKHDHWSQWGIYVWLCSRGRFCCVFYFFSFFTSSPFFTSLFPWLSVHVLTLLPLSSSQKVDFNHVIYYLVSYRRKPTHLTPLWSTPLESIPDLVVSGSINPNPFATRYWMMQLSHLGPLMLQIPFKLLITMIAERWLEGLHIPLVRSFWCWVASRRSCPLDTILFQRHQQAHTGFVPYLFGLPRWVVRFLFVLGLNSYLNAHHLRLLQRCTRVSQQPVPLKIPLYIISVSPIHSTNISQYQEL